MTPDNPAGLREEATILANDAAAVVINPRYFLESAEQQHELGVAVAKVRAALATPDEPPLARPSGLLDGYFEPFTCPDCRLWVAGHAEDCPALAATEPGLDELLAAVEDFRREVMTSAHAMTPAEERLIEAARLRENPGAEG